jgi:hypothetical protein
MPHITRLSLIFTILFDCHLQNLRVEFEKKEVHILIVIYKIKYVHRRLIP